jgi:phage FluMu gp28-like protein
VLDKLKGGRRDDIKKKYNIKPLQQFAVYVTHACFESFESRTRGSTKAVELTRALTAWASWMLRRSSSMAASSRGGMLSNILDRIAT